MDVFISWSGRRSGAAADALRNWLPKIVSTFNPWMSAANIEPGVRWADHLAAKLKSCGAGILCLTPNSLRSPWVLFETGALSKTIKKTHVCPLLIGLQPAQVDWPVAQFQLTSANAEGVLRLVKTLNAAQRTGIVSEKHIEEQFTMWWPKLQEQLSSLPEDEGEANEHTRPDRELLEEILGLVRTQVKQEDAHPGTQRFWSKSWDARIPRLLKALILEFDRELEFQIGDLRIVEAGEKYRFQICRRSGDTYMITLPGDATLEQIVAGISKQIPWPSALEQAERVAR